MIRQFHSDTRPNERHEIELADVPELRWIFLTQDTERRPEMLRVVCRRIGARFHLCLVDALVLHMRREACLNEVTQEHGERRGHEERVAARHLRHHHHRRDRNVRRAREHRSHADDDKSRDRLMTERGAGTAEHCANEKARREHAAGARERSLRPQLPTQRRNATQLRQI